MKRLLVLLAASLVAALTFDAAAPVQYRFTFPEPQHRWMQVEAIFPDLPDRLLELRMSRSSPGRYSLHEFAKNVYDVETFDRDGRALRFRRPDSHGWDVEDHNGHVRARYKVYGDLVDGTYLAIDPTHVHINMPAAVMWAKGLDDRPTTLVFVPPLGAPWQAATQLDPGQAPWEFTAPNLQYLMDSPIELGPLSMRQFSIGPRVFRFAAHHTGTDAELDDFLRDVEKIVREAGAVFGEYPEYEPGHYTFLADYLPYATGDAMEHRNSAVMTASGSIRASRHDLLDSVAHEFFHSWNVERIRPRALEPFDFERANMSAELWLAEGFTQYYSALLLQRAGIADLRTTAEAFTDFVQAALAPGRAARSAEEMSRMAVFTDGAAPVDRTNWSSTVVSYYQLGGSLALALDLMLRERSDGRLTLDDYMRAMWHAHGRPKGPRPGYVDRPYTAADAEARLAEVANNRAFAREFFGRYVQGHDVPDFERLLSHAGFVVWKRDAGRAWWGDVRLTSRGAGLRIEDPVPAASPAYAAGLEQDDEVRSVDNVRVRAPDDVSAIIERRKPGDVIRVVYVDRTGMEKATSVTLAERPHLEVVPIEATGGTLTPADRMFRDRWLGSHWARG
jgi:predicted metalloprotease with PDZ domain